MTSTPPNLTPPAIDADLMALLHLAIREDMGRLNSHGGGGGEGDRTVELSIPAEHHSSGLIVARKPGICSGAFLIPLILKEYDPLLNCTLLTHDGSPLALHQPIAQISGPTRGLLSAERVLLNFLGHLSGIATLTRRYVDAVANLSDAHGKPQPSPAICDTRKTTPGFRRLDKYAVACGGGLNHRMGLYDGVMLKDNHLAALRAQLGAGLSLAELTQHIRQQLPNKILLWLEVDTLEQLAEALPSSPPHKSSGADIILLDNFTPEQLRQAVTLRNERGLPSSVPAGIIRPQLEASGGITLENVRAVALTGVERISIGALTHSAPVLDVALDLEEAAP